MKCKCGRDYNECNGRCVDANGVPSSSGKAIRIFYSELSGRFYATAHYRQLKDGVVLVTGQKFDVTNDIGDAIARYGVTFTKLPSLALVVDVPPAKG